jgi:hypothetical protein
MRHSDTVRRSSRPPRAARASAARETFALSDGRRLSTEEGADRLIICGSGNALLDESGVIMARP